MTDIACIDFRRTDERHSVHANPFWLESASFGKECDDKAAILFSFPAARGRKNVIVHEICIQIITAFAGGTITLNIGAHTLATNAVTTGGNATIVDVDDYIPTGSITNGTIGFYHPADGDFVTAKAAGTVVAPALIVPADTAVPCITATLASSEAITAGAARVYALVSYLPF